MFTVTSRRMALLVAGTAGAVLFTEIVLTRLLSVLLFYHYSFLAVSLALFGLAWGGLLAARRPLGDDPEAFVALVWRRLVAAAVALLGLTVLLAIVPPGGSDGWRALSLALLSSIPLVFLGEVLARALALGRRRINRLYAFDLVASAGAALLAIPLFERVQGPLALAVPALVALLLAFLTSPSRHRVGTAFGLALVAGLVAGATITPGPLLQLTDSWSGRPWLERWNGYSRVRVRMLDSGMLELVIDRTASSAIPRVRASQYGAPPDIDPAWKDRHPDPSYALGRTIGRVAVIGVGGGSDLLPALAAGAQEIVGFELNSRIVELLTETLVGHTAVAARPEVRLVQDEARHALHGRDERYDVIRASLIDTWASTAAGGFVLSENGLYTVEAWRLFLKRLTPAGILATTRWHLPAAPAEAERLIALAAQSLDEEALQPAGDRIIALAMPSEVNDPMAGGPVQTITALVSRTAFTPSEVSRIEEFARLHGGTMLLAPGRPAAERATQWAALMSPHSRAQYLDASPWAIDPPRDARPFFFLQMRPKDVFHSHVNATGPVSAITLSGVQVLMGSVIFALLGAVVLLWQATLLGRRSLGSRGREESLSSSGRAYFALLGLAYMAVQLSLHQRLAVVLGHPTTTLALVIATMLLGTGLGSALAGTGRLGRSAGVVLLWPVGAVAALTAFFPLIGLLSAAPTLELTAAGAGLLSLGMGAALGVALPTGIRLLAAGERRVAEAWAINGAFSVAGASFGALAGLVLGSHTLAALALPCYGTAWVLGWVASRTRTVVSTTLPAIH